MLVCTVILHINSHNLKRRFGECENVSLSHPAVIFRVSLVYGYVNIRLTKFSVLLYVFRFSYHNVGIKETAKCVPIE